MTTDAPARYSVEPDDAEAYRRWLMLRTKGTVVVRLDGKPLRHVMVADERRGYVVTVDQPPALDQDGQIRRSVHHGDVVVGLAP